MAGHRERRFRDHAEEARVLADQMVDSNHRKQMIMIAEDFERFAASAAEWDGFVETERVLMERILELEKDAATPKS